MELKQDIQKFCDDCLEVLQKYDEMIKNKIVDGKCSEFYSNDWKGIGISSITEPIIKYLIFTNLLDKYCMWSEYAGYYEDRKLLDLGVHFGDDVGEVEPNVAIEMKWSYISKKGFFYKNWENNIKNDIIKLHRCRKPSEKYFMQFIFIPNEHFNENENIGDYINTLSEQINRIVDHRIVKNKIIELVYNNSFKTIGTSESDKHNFTILLWHIA